MKNIILLKTWQQRKVCGQFRQEHINVNKTTQIIFALPSHIGYQNTLTLHI